MIRIVLDTDVLVAAFDSPTGASRQLLIEILDGNVSLLMSTTLLLEYEAVLTRPAVLHMIGVDGPAVIAGTGRTRRVVRAGGDGLSLAPGCGGSG